MNGGLASELIPRTVALLILATLFAVGLAIRLNGLGDESLWYDEVASWSQSHGTLLEVLPRTAGDNYPPLHNLIL